MKLSYSFLPAVLSLIMSTIANGAETAKPWEWSPAERAQRRLDRNGRIDRIRAYEIKNARREQRTHTTSVDQGDVIDGTANPELFFPTELLQRLIVSSFIDLPQVYPLVVRQRSTDLFRSDVEWEYFQSVTADLAELLQRDIQLRKARRNAPSSGRVRIDKLILETHAQRCVAMASALRTLRNRFGRQRFDRMLYEIVPPGHLMSWGSRVATEGSDPFEADVQKRLRDEENCQ